MPHHLLNYRNARRRKLVSGTEAYQELALAVLKLAIHEAQGEINVFNIGSNTIRSHGGRRQCVAIAKETYRFQAQQWLKKDGEMFIKTHIGNLSPEDIARTITQEVQNGAAG